MGLEGQRRRWRRRRQGGSETPGARVGAHGGVRRDERRRVLIAAFQRDPDSFHMFVWHQFLGILLRLTLLVAIGCLFGLSTITRNRGWIMQVPNGGLIGDAAVMGTIVLTAFLVSSVLRSTLRLRAWIRSVADAPVPSKEPDQRAGK